ncbi:hypothetical protein RYX36_024824 [Vicia faba]
MKIVKLVFRIRSCRCLPDRMVAALVEQAAARRIARKVSARSGGLPMVQTLRVVCVDSTEIACMFLKPKWIGADRVQNLEAQEGLDVKKGFSSKFSNHRDAIGSTSSQQIRLCLQGCKKILIYIIVALYGNNLDVDVL